MNRLHRAFILAILGLAHSASAKDILLITSSELAPAWKPFAEWKENLGQSIEVVSVEQIKTDYVGPDAQERIRLCVRDHIDNHGTKSIILGGDSLPGGLGIVPDRDTVHSNFFGKISDTPTDIYYLSPTNWDADGDGIYGEFIDDQEAITYPDGTIGLGRIPIRTAEDVAAYTDKVISYQSIYPKGDFGQTITYTCAVSGAYPKVRRSWDDHVSQVLPDGKLQRYFLDRTPWDKEQAGDYLLNPENLTAIINSQTSGKFHIHGHGLLQGWVLEGDSFFTQQHVAKLSNKDAYPIITTVSCFTGHYDSREAPCISEAMLRAPQAGAIAIVAPSRTGKPHFSNPRTDFPLMKSEGKLDGTTKTMTLFWENGIGKNLTTGEALMLTKASLSEEAKAHPSFHQCLCELNLLGDPTLAVQPGKINNEPPAHSPLLRESSLEEAR